MDPLTHEELNRIEKTGMLIRIIPFSREQPEWRTIEKKALDKLIAAARASIPRPIADAPRDGTEIDVFDSTGKRYAKVKWSKVFNKWAQFAGYIGEDSAWGELQIEPVSFLPIPKGGAS
jgi:hypothetical protein